MIRVKDMKWNLLGNIWVLFWTTSADSPGRKSTESCQAPWLRSTGLSVHVAGGPAPTTHDHTNCQQDGDCGNGTFKSLYLQRHPTSKTVAKRHPHGPTLVDAMVEKQAREEDGKDWGVGKCKQKCGKEGMEECLRVGCQVRAGWNRKGKGKNEGTEG